MQVRSLPTRGVEIGARRCFWSPILLVIGLAVAGVQRLGWVRGQKSLLNRQPRLICLVFPLLQVITLPLWTREACKCPEIRKEIKLSGSESPSPPPLPLSPVHSALGQKLWKGAPLIARCWQRQVWALSVEFHIGLPLWTRLFLRVFRVGSASWPRGLWALVGFALPSLKPLFLPFQRAAKEHPDQQEKSHPEPGTAAGSPGPPSPRGAEGALQDPAPAEQLCSRDSS